MILQVLIVVELESVVENLLVCSVELKGCVRQLLFERNRGVLVSEVEVCEVVQLSNSVEQVLVDRFAFKELIVLIVYLKPRSYLASLSTRETHNVLIFKHT